MSRHRYCGKGTKRYVPQQKAQRLHTQTFWLLLGCGCGVCGVVWCVVIFTFVFSSSSRFFLTRSVRYMTLKTRLKLGETALSECGTPSRNTVSKRNEKEKKNRRGGVGQNHKTRMVERVSWLIFELRWMLKRFCFCFCFS